MKVEEIPADLLVEMTPELYQEFCQGGCVPACHFTHEFINIGSKFKLSTVDLFSRYEGNARYGTTKTTQVMLAENTDVKEYLKKHKKEIKSMEDLREQDRRSGRTGCFRVNGKIVH